MDYTQEQEELLDAIEIIVSKYFNKIPRMYNGIVISKVSDKQYVVEVNGLKYTLPQYGDKTIALNSMVKVFVPDNNYSMAYFI